MRAVFPLVLFLAFLTFAAFGASAADRGGFLIYGIGNTACSNFVQAVDGAPNRQQDEADRFALLSWAQGYLTHYNAYATNTYSIAGNSDTPGIQLWLFNYCMGHPDVPFETAVAALVNTLYPARMVDGVRRR